MSASEYVQAAIAAAVILAAYISDTRALNRARKLRSLQTLNTESDHAS